MGSLKNTDWPPEFPQIGQRSFSLNYSDNELRRTSGDVQTQVQNRVQEPFSARVTWTFTPYWLSVFEGWFRHNLWRGLRGCAMTLPIGGTSVQATVFFNTGYTATPNDTYSYYTVTATLEVTPDV